METEQDWHRAGVYNAALVKRRAFPIRFVRSYRMWRAFLPIGTSLRYAWAMARS